MEEAEKITYVTRENARLPASAVQAVNPISRAAARLGKLCKMANARAGETVQAVLRGKEVLANSASSIWTTREQSDGSFFSLYEREFVVAEKNMFLSHKVHLHSARSLKIHITRSTPDNVEKLCAPLLAGNGW